MKKKVIVISGPTASGKSAVAEWLVTKFDILNQIINADSMQIYKDLPILTAIPELADHHHLYAFQDYHKHYSMGKWFGDVTHIINNSDERAFLIVGGTGLYIKGLIHGISSIPDIPITIRKILQNKFDEIGIKEFHKYLGSIDPEAQKSIEVTDKQRMIRAAEVFLHTGKSIRSFDDQKTRADYEFLHLTLDPERKYLYEMCNDRFDSFCKNGALDEVKIFADKLEDTGSSYMLEKALGYRELLGFVEGALSLGEAVTLAKQKTRNYAKRQLTWFRGQEEAKSFEYNQFSTDLLDLVYREVDKFLSV